MGDLLKEGLLLKEEKGVAKWKKRWIVFRLTKDTAVLYYYKVDDYINQSVPVGSFNVQSCALYDYIAKPFAFELVLPPVIQSGSGLVYPADHFRFQATNADEQQSWMNVLRHHTKSIDDIKVSKNGEEGASGVGVDEMIKKLALPRRKLRDFGDDEAALIELFPDVEVEIILDALDFCDGNRNAAIQLLAKQNRLNTPTEELDSISDELDDVDDGEEPWEEEYIDKAEMFSGRGTIMEESKQEKQRGSLWQTYHKKDTAQTPVKRACSWHRGDPSDAAVLSKQRLHSYHGVNEKCDNTESGAKDIAESSQDSAILLHIVGAVRNGSYMEYILEIITHQARWLVYRRYSNFYCLNERLRKLGIVDPTKHILPPKGIKGDNSDGLVRKRTVALGKYLNNLVDTDQSFFLSHPIGKTFLDPKIPSVFYNKHLKGC